MAKHEMAEGALAHKKEEGKKSKKVHHFEVHKDAGGKGYIVTHHHDDPMQEPERQSVPQGGLDEHAEQMMGQQEEPQQA